MQRKQNYRTYVKDMAIVSMCAAMIVISAWLTVPFTVSFTLQTLAIFVISSLFVLRISFSAVMLYVLLGMCGLPVFAGFSSGLAALLGPSGGFIFAFLFIPPIIRAFKPQTSIRLTVAMLTSLVACYFLGTLWYTITCAEFTSVGVLSSVSLCVLPFIIPDLAKIAFAVFLWSRLKPFIKI